MRTEPETRDDEYIEQLLGCYHSRHSSFVKIYTTFVVFSLGFVAFILAPMMALKLDEESLPGEIAQQKEELETIRPRYVELKAQDEELQVQLNQLNNELAKLDSQQAAKAREAIAAREAEDRVKEQLEATIKEKSITRNMLHGARIAMDPEKYPNLQDAAKRIYDANVKKVREHEAKIARLSAEEEVLQRKLSIVERERQEIEAQREILAGRALPIRQQATEIATRASELGEELSETETKLQRGREALAQMDQRQTDIRDRLSSFQSPVGAMPLSLTEASLAFPLIVAVGFLIYAILLADLLRLRCEYHRVASAKHALEVETIRRRLALVVPLWLDPLKAAWRNWGGAALVFLPALAYIAVVWLLGTDRFFDLEARRLDYHLIRFYGVLYVVGVLFIILGTWRIVAEWSAYRSMLLQELPSAQNEQTDRAGIA